MASIFTFDPDIPRVASPWARQLETQRAKSSSLTSARDEDAHAAVVKLEPEPQEGPVEYKLHLLLRPRRVYSSVSREPHLVQGSKPRKIAPSSRTQSETKLGGASGFVTPITHGSRQHRLEQLTTQLLWRLQQSSMHHASSASNVILPHLPSTSAELQPPQKPAKLIHGLEESQGALYEIGVADDGTFMGLSEDEMEESINNLRAMAACLGCEVELLRQVQVGQAEWLEDVGISNESTQRKRASKLIVAEVLVKPRITDEMPDETNNGHASHVADLAGPGTHSISQTLERETSAVKRQLRISLTGATSSGKSSLLGTLTTSALDNARGKSRLSTLKHRHEINSGLTSSVSQELIGYRENATGATEVINYAAEDITSWIDIHNAAAEGRLVLVSDSAGHPRYRRTAVKSLVGWNPHWTILCVPANELDVPSVLSNTEQISASGLAESDLSTAYVDLCLRLNLPLVVVVTKLDAASKTSLRSTLASLLTLLKETHRKPVILPAAVGSGFEDDSGILGDASMAQALHFVEDPEFEPTVNVPILMTSAVQGTGIETLHALLSALPVVAAESLMVEPIFHIEDIYTIPTSPGTTIVAGLLRNGAINVGAELSIGPFSLESEDSDSDIPRRRTSSGTHSRPFPGAFKLPISRGGDELEWRRVRVTSIRNLRLPVKTLQPDQVGTIALDFLPSPPGTAVSTSTTSPNSEIGLTRAELDSSPKLPQTNAARIRKGMILSPHPRAAASTVIVEFSRNDLGSLAVGSQVVVYIASVRTAARVVSASVAESVPPSQSASPAATIDMGGSISSLAALHLDEHDEFSRGAEAQRMVAGQVTHENLLVTLGFEGGREFVQKGAKVLVMPGGGPGVFASSEGRGAAALEGFVGIVVDVA